MVVPEMEHAKSGNIRKKGLGTRLTPSPPHYIMVSIASLFPILNHQLDISHALWILPLIGVLY